MKPKEVIWIHRRSLCGCDSNTHLRSHVQEADETDVVVGMQVRDEDEFDVFDNVLDLGSSEYSAKLAESALSAI